MVDYRFQISPEFIKSDLVTGLTSYVNGNTIEIAEVGVYSSMTQVLSGGTNGSSILTGLTVPIMLTQTTIDMGYYSPFDGAAEQVDVVTNFIFTSSTVTPYTFTVYNSSQKSKTFLEFSTYTVDWGDNTPPEALIGETLSHTYPIGVSGYTITMKQNTPFGINIVSKEVQVPFKDIVIYNPKGRAFFQPLGGNWASTPVSYDYIYPYDAENTVAQQVSSGYTTVPFVVSGYTTSRLPELKLYGVQPYRVGVPVIQGGQLIGVVNDISVNYTGYTIQGVDYYDYLNGLTIYFANSSGFTDNMIEAVPITKEPILMGVIDQPQITSNVFVERGKNTAYEQIRRLGEVNTVNEMENYGYGYFLIEKKG